MAANGFRQLTATTGDTTNRGLIELYARVGFAHVGMLRAVGFKRGQ